ncbi:MAG: response regulator [Gammaproteobacteria bacterium]|nr:response regulator [Gammaproteobacteria bacterium]
MSSVKTLVLISATALVYALSGRLGLMLAIPPGYATAIFPAAGVALAAVLLYGRWALPGVWLGSFVMNLWIGADTGRALSFANLPVPALIASGALLQAWSGAALMRRFIGFPSALDDERDILKFIVLCGMAACLAGASVGITTLWSFGAVTDDKFVANWANWWLGDVIGVLIMVPVLLAFLAQPREQWSKRRFTLSVPLLIALGFVLVAYVEASRWEQQRIDAEFNFRATNLADNMEAALAKQLESLAWITHYYASSEHFTRDGFRQFVAPIIAENGAARALEWLPKVPDTQRTKFEAQVRNEGFADFQIVERDSNNRRVRAASRPEYYPVTYVEPWVGNEIVFGYDLASEPKRRAALNQARSTGRPTVSARVRLLQQNNEAPERGVVLFFPVISLQGFVLEVITLDNLVDTVMRPSDRDLFTLELTDQSAPPAEQLLFPGGAVAPSSQAMALSYLRSIEFAGRKWQARFSPTPAYMQQNNGWQSWVVLAAGLMFVSLLETFLLSVSGRATRVERMIEQRTYELSQAHRVVSDAQRIAHLGHWSWDLHSNAERWSAEQARIFGFEANELTISHEKFIEAIHPGDRETVATAIQTALNGKNSYRVECRIRQVAGALRHVVYVGEVERGAGGTPLRMVGIVLDVTERKRVELEIIAAKEEAMRANRAKSEFLSSMSHELRTPLNAVLGFAQLLGYDQQLTAQHQATVTKIRTAGEHLLNLINDVLDLSRIETGHVNLSMEPVALDPLIDECRILTQALADKRGLHFVASQCGAGVYVQVDRTRLKQVLVNLLSNAVKYNCEGGEIELSYTLHDGSVCISVRDTGKGLSADQQAHLFQSFNRLGQERGEIEGTGIGLVITKRLVELMQGELTFRSSVDVGTVFSIELLTVPTPQAAEEKVQAVAEQMQHAAPPVKFSLLCVEDNPVNMTLVQALVKKIWPQSSFVGAGSAEAGLDIAFKQNFDVILMDINLPGMDGYAALDYLKADMRTAHVPVLALTANAMREDVQRGKDAGFAAYLTKPFDMGLLIDTVSALLAQRPAVEPVRRILIAEDNAVNQEILRAMVQALGYDLDMVGDGALALAAVQKTPYGLVLMDCEMPHMNGYDATCAIRRLTGAVAQLPVVAVSAHAAGEDAQQRAQAGMTDVLPKPINITQLKAVLERYLPAA